MLRKTLLAAALGTLCATSAWATVSVEEAKQLGTTLTPIGAEKAGNKDGASGRLPKRNGVSPGLLRRRKAAPGHHHDSWNVDSAGVPTLATNGDATYAWPIFSSGQYNLTGVAGPYAGVKYLAEIPSQTFWSPEALAGAGVR